MIYKTLTKVVLSMAMVIAVLSVIPSHAYAFDPMRIIDPLCIFACDDYRQNTSSTVYNTGSYNTNSTVTTGANSPIVVQGSTASTPATPVYTYNNTVAQASPLYVSCYSTPTNANVGASVSWISSVNGGNGSYYVSWSGTEGLSGTGSSITKSYSYGGSKSASVTVTSGGQTISQNCSGTVTIYDSNNTSYSSPTYTYYNPVVYTQPTYYYSPLTVYCSSNTTFSPVGSYVTWTAYPSGGNNGYYGYTYRWSGTDNLYGSASSVNAYYNTTGMKTAYVTVYSNGQTTSAQCSNTVTVGSPSVNYTYVPQNYTAFNSGIQIGCAADTVSTRIGVPVTWNAEATGAGYGSGFTYAWTGTDGLSGNQSSAITTYVTSGLKSAVVTVTAPNGQSQSKACGNTVTVKSTAVASKASVTKKAVPAEVAVAPVTTPNPYSAATLFSLQNIPWGWVAVLVILVLMGMVFYLLFNKKKI